MSASGASAPGSFSQKVSVDTLAGWRALTRGRRYDRLAFALALCAVPVSIAVCESFLVAALVLRAVRVARGQAQIVFPRVFWFWLVWAGLELFSWILSPQPSAGWGEIRRLLLLAVLFFLQPSLDGAAHRLTVWKGVFLSASLGSLFVVGDFFARLLHYRREISVTADTSLYLRTGGLLNNWMVYGTVEILVVAGLLSFWNLYPEERRRWLPVLLINGLAILLSLTRMTWLACLLLFAIDLACRRSKWFWALPLLPVALYVLAPSPIRSRVKESARFDYYSNAERLQMVRVGWRMVREKPLTGVGPGRAGKLYRAFLSPSDPVPAYHGHLHNNLIQIAAEFGLPVALAGITFAVALFWDLAKAFRKAKDPENRFLCRTAILALAGFLTAGLFDYTYGHSLGLILLTFSVIPPLLPESPGQTSSGAF